MDRIRLKSILQDKNLARLGDAYINFIFSLAITEVEHVPTGTKVSDRILAMAAKRSGLRELLPNRVSRGSIANAVEAIIVFVWIKKLIILDEAVNILKASLKDPSRAISNLICEAMNRIEIE